MRVLEWLFCGFVRLLWACAQVDRPGALPGQRPWPADDRAEIHRCLIPGRTALPGW